MRSAQQAAASAGIRIFAQRIKREKHNNNPLLSEKFTDIFSRTVIFTTSNFNIRFIVFI